jgi:hypothetical protein
MVCELRGHFGSLSVAGKCPLCRFYKLTEGSGRLAEYFGVDRLFLGVTTPAYNCADRWFVDHDKHPVSACLVLNLALTCSSGYPSL